MNSKIEDKVNNSFTYNVDIDKKDNVKDSGTKYHHNTTSYAIDRHSKKGNSKNKKNTLKIPKSVQDSIPYIAVYKDGIIEVEPGVFSKSYYINDANFKVATDEEQDKMFLNYQGLLNTFGSDIGVQITINNKNIDKENLLNEILLKEKGDNLDEFRDEYNKMLLDKLEEGRNNLINEKYLTLTIKEKDIDKASSVFTRLDAEVSKNIKKITDIPSTPIPIERRLEILHDIYNLGHEGTLLAEAEYKGEKITAFNLDSLKPMGLNTKDVIAPSGMSFKNKYFMMGDKFGRALFLQKLPNRLSTDFLADIIEIPCNMVTSVHYEPIDTGSARKLVSKQITNIREDVINAQKKAAKSGYSSDLISPALQKAQMNAEELYDAVNSNNQKLFLMTLVIVHFADSLEELDNDTNAILDEANKYVCDLKCLMFQQEKGLNSAFPLGINKLSVKRLLPTDASSVFMPFTSQELADKNGMYYGLNSVSKNLLLFNRKLSKNGNGLILGAPGSGKSFASKREIINILLNTDDEVFIIDPEREYTTLALPEYFNGEVIKMAVGTKVYINPFDLDLDRGKKDDSGEEDPVTVKSDYICTLCEIMMGGHSIITPSQKSIIDRCVRKIYNPYLQHIGELNRIKGENEPTITSAPDAAPTLQDFYNLLLSQPEPEAQSIALALELYCQGSFDLFAHHTNVQTNNRFTVYDTKDLGTSMKELGLSVCLNDIWNRMIENSKKDKNTWIYIDEFHLLTKTQTSADYVMNIWKRARKWNGLPTGLTQNVGDLLRSPAAQAVILNSDFIMMLGQSAVDRDILGEMLKISPSQLSYITNSDPGQGLIYTGKTIIPFTDNFPKGKLYAAMSTKAGERIITE